MDDVASIFDRYQAVRHRLPTQDFLIQTTKINSLMELTDKADAFIFDAFGVLNVGETPIPGAADRLNQLRRAGSTIRILSNAASYNHARATKKFCDLGVKIASDEIITSRDVALQEVGDGTWGCIAAENDDLTDIPIETRRLGDKKSDYDSVDGFLFLSTENWHMERQSILETSLLERSRPVLIANADIAAPRDNGFSLEPGYFGHLLADKGILDIRFFGKPFPEVFDMLSASLENTPADRIAMCGDTLHTDILGAAAQGWQTVLVEQDGMYCGVGADRFILDAQIIPTWRLPRI